MTKPIFVSEEVTKVKVGPKTLLIVVVVPPPPQVPAITIPEASVPKQFWETKNGRTRPLLTVEVPLTSRVVAGVVVPMPTLLVEVAK